MHKVWFGNEQKCLGFSNFNKSYAKTFFLKQIILISSIGTSTYFLEYTSCNNEADTQNDTKIPFVVNNYFKQIPSVLPYTLVY